MNTLIIEVQIDRKAALLAGKVLQASEAIEVTPAMLGKYWPRLVARLDMSTQPPRLRQVEAQGNLLTLPDNTITALIAVYEEEDAAAERKAEWERAAEEKRRREIAENETALTALEANPPAPKPCVRDVYANSDYSAAGLYRVGEFSEAKIGTYEGAWPIDNQPDLGLPHWVWPNPYGARVDALLARLRVAAQEADDRAFAAAQSAIAEALAKAKAAKDASEQAKRAAAAAKYAARLESGYWEKETPNYSTIREGAPWCAKVTFHQGAKPVYEWGEATGKWGKAGLLRVACVPGEFVAWGQKDLRRPDRSTHEILHMQTDGRMLSVTATEAFRIWQETHKG